MKKKMETTVVHWGSINLDNGKEHGNYQDLFRILCLTSLSMHFPILGSLEQPYNPIIPRK